MNDATITIHERPGELDRLSEAVLASWQRPVSRPLYRGSLWTIIATALTLGLWPMFKARRWLRDYAAVRDQRATMTLEWFGVSSTTAQSISEPTRSTAITINRPLHVVATVALIAATIVLFNALRGHHLAWGSMYATPLTLPQQAYAALIAIAAIVQFFQLLDHHHQFNHFLAALNPLLARNDLPTVRSLSLFRFNLLDWIGGLLLCSGGGIWPLLVIVIVGLQRSYIRRNVRVHVQIGDRIRDLLAKQTPPLRLPPRHDLLERCANLQCGAPLPNEASFCPRCGKSSNQATATTKNWQKEAAAKGDAKTLNEAAAVR